MATVQTQIRQRVLRAFVRRGLLEHGDGEEMGGWDHGGGFSVDASVRIEGADLARRERLLRYCALPPFALDHLHQHDAEHLRYDIPEPRPDGPRALLLTPLELIDRVAALVLLPWCRPRACTATATTECWPPTLSCAPPSPRWNWLPLRRRPPAPTTRLKVFRAGRLIAETPASVAAPYLAGRRVAASLVTRGCAPEGA